MTDELKPHPEDFCEECGLVNVIWSAPNKLWNKLARRPDGTDPMLCPTCFIKLVEKDAATGVQAAIDAALESVKEYLESAIQHRIISGDLYMVGRNDAFRDAAGFIESRIRSHPLAEAQARIAELDLQLARAKEDLRHMEQCYLDAKNEIAQLRGDLYREIGSTSS